MAKPPVPNPRADFIRTIRSLDSHQLWRTFADFCEVAAISLGNQFERSTVREQRYEEILKPYSAEDRQAFPKMLAHVVDGLEEGLMEVDFLGTIFQELELSNHWKGQFFTPYPLCRLMSDVTFEGFEGIVETKGYVTVQDPACGSGALLLAAAATCRSKGFDPARFMWITCIDIDSTAAHMAMIQLSLCGVAAEIIVGDTLRMEIRDVFRTPCHYLGLWDARLRARKLLDSVIALDPGAPSPTPPAVVRAPLEHVDPSVRAPNPAGQLRLF